MSSRCCAVSASAGWRRPRNSVTEGVRSLPNRRNRRRSIGGYLPQELDDAELDALVSAAIAETGARGPKDMGQVMKAVMAKADGRADGKRASERVREALTAA